MMLNIFLGACWLFVQLLWNSLSPLFSYGSSPPSSSCGLFALCYSSDVIFLRILSSMVFLFFLHKLSLVISSAWWFHLCIQAGNSQITIFSPHLSWAPGPYTHLPCRWLHLGVSQHLTYSTCPNTTSTCPDLLSHKGPKPWSLLWFFIPNF